MAKQKKKHIQLLSPENYIRQKARNLPIYKCWINTNWQEQGMAQVIVSRKHDNGNLTTGFYMVDLKCLGVRDSQYSFNRPEFELDELLKGANVELKMVNVDYNLAHNVVYAAMEYADELGFKAHKDFNSITKYILEDDTDDIELIDIECGNNGRPLFIKTEAFSEAEANSIIRQLERSVGKGNYDFIADESGLFSDEDDPFDSMTAQEREDLFKDICQNEIADLEDDELNELVMLTDSIFMNDLTTEDAVNSIFLRRKGELDMPLIEVGDKKLDKKTVDVLLKMKKSISNPATEKLLKSLSFDVLFKGRDAISEKEMFEYQRAIILQIVVRANDVFNAFEAQMHLIAALKISDIYKSDLYSEMANVRVNSLKAYFGILTSTKSENTFQFKIQLKNISKPTVWRRLLMPADATFKDFHDAIQIAFGWENSHLFAFSPDGYQSSPQIELESDDDSFSNYEKLNAETLTLDEIFTHEKQTYSYIYDFGDDWDHKITLEKIIPDQKTSIPKIIKAQGACPPEDCGGPWGYENLKEILADKKHPEHKEMKEWLGLSPRQHWDPEQFDMPEYQKIMDSVFGDLD